MERTLPRPVDWLVFAALAFAASGLILWLGRDLWFYQDECAFIHDRSLWVWSDLMRAHNEHWTLVPVVAWRVTQDAFGVGSYLPFRTLIVIAHVALAAGAFAFLFRRGRSVAIAGAALLLLLGTAWENVYWAFQISFVGATAFGV